MFSNKIAHALQPVFVSKKLEQDLKPKEAKLSIVNQQFVVYHYVCDLCKADYVDYTSKVLLNTKIRQSASIFMKHMVGGIFWMTVILSLWESADANLIV